MLVVAYLVLFAAVIFFAWVIEERYGRPCPYVRATPDEHARLALVYATRAQSYLVKSQQQQQVARQLRTPPASNSSRPATPSTTHCDLLSSHYQQRAARMQSLGRQHHKMSLVHDPQNSAKPAHRPSFTPDSNPAKLALVPRN